MHHGRSLTALLLTVCICPFIASAYSLVDNYSGASFFDGFDFSVGADPTHGHTAYLSRADAQGQGLISTSGGTVYMGVDSKNQAPNGRSSVRITTKKVYNKGLFILDLAHMPASVCGSWPSFWSYGTDQPWPIHGEIDIIEGIHTSTVNALSLHTNAGCSIDGTGMLGSVATKNCDIAAAGQTSNAGCGITSSFANSYGTSLNSIGGGVYAMEWTSTFIKVWYFPRGAIPADVSSNSPNPANWGLPDANYAGSCNFDQHFIDHKVILDTTFCGDWAGATWNTNPTCKALAGSCDDYVSKNPTAFAESYWRINSFRVFK